MKIFLALVAVVLCLFVEFSFAVPVECSTGGNILSVETMSAGCNPISTCEHVCGNSGCSVYYKIPSHLQGQYSRYCRKENPTTWRDQVINQRISNLKNSAVSYGLANKVSSYLGNVFSQFARICARGAKVSGSQVEHAFNQVADDLRDSMEEMRDNVSRNRIYRAHLLDTRNLQMITRGIIKEFKDKFNSGAFQFCSCSGFAQSINQRNQFMNMVNGLCQQRCGSNAIVTLEEQAHQLELQAETLELE